MVPKTLYPWGDTTEVTYREGVLKSKFNFNAKAAADYLKNSCHHVGYV